ncbi:MAG: efflux RND transporter periplasmic adaptor subunit [Planctomycetes bacterium]|nr:efflux RND transporter periplasmic adaptor subunit [Planctomycetota bacterium]
MKFTQFALCIAAAAALILTIHHRMAMTDALEMSAARASMVFSGEENQPSKGDNAPGKEATQEPGKEPDGEEKEGAPSRLKHENGKTVIELNEETQSRIGLVVEVVKPLELQPEVLAYGVVEENPGESFTLRAPCPGFITAGSESVWPKLGARVAAGTVLGSLEVRLTAVERLDIQSRRLETQGDIDELEADLASARASFENKKKLNEQGRVVSDRAMEEAGTKVRVDEARLVSARERKALLDKLLGNKAGGIETVLLSAVSDGEVVQLLTRPGEAVESGQPLLRIVRLNHLIARIELPIGEIPNDLAGSARIYAIGTESRLFDATLLARAPTVGLQTRGLALLFDVKADGDDLCPGAPVAAYIARKGSPLFGALIPRGAMLRFAGSTRVYIQTGDERFEPRDIFPNSPTPDGWFVASGLAPGERIVIQAAQVLLSEELKGQIELEEESEE